MMATATILTKNGKVASLTERRHPTLSVLPNKASNITRTHQEMR